MADVVKIPGLGLDEPDRNPYDFTEDVAEVGFGEAHKGYASDDLRTDFSTEMDASDKSTAYQKEFFQNPPKPEPKRIPPEVNPTKEFLERVEALKKEGIEPGNFQKEIETDTGEQTSVTVYFYQCKICSCQMNTAQNAEIHVAGQRHKKNISSRGKTHSVTVNVDPMVPDRYIDNLLKRVNKPLQIHVGLSELMEYHDLTDPNEKPLYTCLVCKFSYTADRILSHLDGSKHKMLFLKSRSDAAFTSLQYNTAGFALNNALNKALFPYAKKEQPSEVQVKAVGHGEFQSRKLKTEENTRKRKFNDEVYVPSKKLQGEQQPAPSPGKFQKQQQHNQKGSGPRQPFSKNPQQSNKQNFNAAQNQKNSGYTLNTGSNFTPVGQNRGNFSGQGSNRGNFSGQGSNRGNFSGQGSNRGNFSGQGSNRGNFSDQGSNRGNFSDQGSNRGNFSGRGANRGNFTGQGSNRGNFSGQGLSQSNFSGQGINQGNFSSQGLNQGNFSGQGNFSSPGLNQGLLMRPFQPTQANFSPQVQNQQNFSLPTQNQGDFPTAGPAKIQGNYSSVDLASSYGNNSLATKPTFRAPACALSDSEMDLLDNLTQRKILNDTDAQYLMSIVKNLTHALMQYRIRQMPPQLKETLMSTVMEGGSEALADLMH